MTAAIPDENPNNPCRDLGVDDVDVLDRAARAIRGQVDRQSLSRKNRDTLGREIAERHPANRAPRTVPQLNADGVILIRYTSDIRGFPARDVEAIPLDLNPHVAVAGVIDIDA